MRLSFIFISFLFFIINAEAKPISIELNNVSMDQAIKTFANFMKVNVVVSKEVTGFVSLKIDKANDVEAFNSLLLTNGLGFIELGKIWFVAKQEELIKLKQSEINWQELVENSAPLITRVWQIRYAKVEDIVKMLEAGMPTLLSKRGHLRSDIRTNLLYAHDIQNKIDVLHSLIKRLDVPVQQIAITARLVSIDSDKECELGIDLTVKSSDAMVKSAFRGEAETGHYSLAVAKLADGSLLDVKLSALEKAGHAEVVSSPSLFTTNQQPASIEAGEEIPYQEVSESGGTAVAFKKAVLGLKVIPQVLPGNKVLLQLQINQDRPSNKMVQGVPAISTRQMTTSVIVNNHQTIVLGGIYETNEEQGQRGLPFINRIPGLGWLFNQRYKRSNKRELLIFITPKIIVQVT